MWWAIIGLTGANRALNSLGGINVESENNILLKMEFSIKMERQGIKASVLIIANSIHMVAVSSTPLDKFPNTFRPSFLISKMKQMRVSPLFVWV